MKWLGERRAVRELGTVFGHETGSDRQHCAELTGLRMRDARFTLAWVQADEFAFPGQPGDAELRVELAHSMEGQDLQVYLLPQEVWRFVQSLLAEYYRHVDHSAPMVHEPRWAA